MMHVAPFAKADQEQVDEGCENFCTRDWTKFVWKYTSNPRQLLVAARAVLDPTEGIQRLDKLAWSQTCLYAQGRTQFCKTHFNPNQEWQASTSIWCPLRRLCRMEANPHANQLWGRVGVGYVRNDLRIIRDGRSHRHL